MPPLIFSVDVFFFPWRPSDFRRLTHFLVNTTPLLFKGTCQKQETTPLRLCRMGTRRDDCVYSAVWHLSANVYSVLPPIMGRVTLHPQSLPTVEHYPWNGSQSTTMISTQYISRDNTLYLFGEAEQSPKLSWSFTSWLICLSGREKLDSLHSHFLDYNISLVLNCDPNLSVGLSTPGCTVYLGLSLVCLCSGKGSGSTICCSFGFEILEIKKDFTCKHIALEDTNLSFSLTVQICSVVGQVLTLSQHKVTGGVIGEK